MNAVTTSALAAGGHAVHYGFAIFCVGVVLFCIAAAKLTSPPKDRRETVAGQPKDR